LATEETGGDFRDCAEEDLRVRRDFAGVVGDRVLARRREDGSRVALQENGTVGSCSRRRPIASASGGSWDFSARNVGQAVASSGVLGADGSEERCGDVDDFVQPQYGRVLRRELARAVALKVREGRSQQAGRAGGGIA